MLLQQLIKYLFLFYLFNFYLNIYLFNFYLIFVALLLCYLSSTILILRSLTTVYDIIFVCVKTRWILMLELFCFCHRTITMIVICSSLLSLVCHSSTQNGTQLSFDFSVPFYILTCGIVLYCVTLLLWVSTYTIFVIDHTFFTYRY